MLTPQLKHSSTLPFLFLAFYLALSTILASASSGPHLLEYGAVSTSSATTVSSLSVVDITLDAPNDPITCGATEIQWSWDRSGTLPEDPISLSIINATDFNTPRKRTSKRRHMNYVHNLSLSTRAGVEGVALEGGSDLPFDQMSFQWDQIAVPPGSYRLLLTVIASGESVVSDPFDVSQGHTENCLNPTSTTSSSVASTHAPPSTSSGSTSGSIRPSVTSSVTGNDTSSTHTPSTSTSAPLNSSSGGVQSQDGTQSSAPNNHHSKNTGAIIAGVLIPLLFIVGGAIAFFWRQHHKTFSQSVEKSGGNGEDAWYHRFFSFSSQGGESQKHHRQISGPEMASAAGLASVAKLVPAALRNGKDETELRRFTPNEPRTPSRRVTVAESEASDEWDQESPHWVDFGADEAHNVDGAHPLSPSTIDSQPFSVIGGNQQLYAQGQNVHLSQWSSGSSAARDSATSSNLRESIATFSSVSSTVAGRDLLAGVPLSRSPSKTDESAQSTSAADSGSSSSSSSPFGDENAASTISPASTDATTLQRSDSQATAKIARSDSTNSRTGIKRKPVPRFSGSGQAETREAEAIPADPFSNANAIDSGSSIELLRTPTEGDVTPSTPPRMSFKSHAATPSSIPETAFSDTESIRGHTPDFPRSVTSESLASSNRPGAEGREDSYHLSINLGSEGGFRMSFS